MKLFIFLLFLVFFSVSIHAESNIISTTYVAIPKGLSVPIQSNFKFAFNIIPPDRPDFFLFGEQITPESYPATLTSVLYPSLNSFIKDDNGQSFPSAAGARLRATIFTANTDSDISQASKNNIKQAEFTITKDFSDPNQIKSYADFNEFDTPDITINQGSFFVLLQLIDIGTSNLNPNGSNFFYLADTRQPSKAVVSIDNGRNLVGVGVQINGYAVDFLIAGKITLAGTNTPPPEIQNVTFSNNKLSIFGKQLSLTGKLIINNKTVVPTLSATYSAKKNRLQIKATSEQLNLKKGFNEIIFVEGRFSSPSYRLNIE